MCITWEKAAIRVTFTEKIGITFFQSLINLWLQHERCPSVNIHWGCVVVTNPYLSAKLKEVHNSNNSDNIKYIEQILIDIHFN